jgi:transposase
MKVREETSTQGKGFQLAHTITHFSPDIRCRIDAFFSRFGQGMSLYIESHSRRDKIDALEARSDAELAAMGLKRDEIVGHVYRDMIWL